MTAGYTRGELFTSSDASWRPSHPPNSSTDAVYVFGDGQTFVDSPEQPNEAIELSVMRSRQRERQERPWQKHHDVGKISDVVYYDRDITPGDTLQGLALQYGCTVGQLLKANNMIVEQEFKMMKVLKIPVRSNGILAAQFEKEKRELERLETANQEKKSLRFASPKHRIQEISIKSDMKSPTSSAMSFLMRMDEDLQRIKQSNRKYSKTSERRRDWILNAPLIHPIKSKVPDSTINDAKACGITWHGWLIILLVVGIIIPGLIGLAECL